MKRVLFSTVVAVASCAASADAIPPRVGCTISLLPNGHHEYTSDSFFQKRPIVEEMRRYGLDVRLCDGGGGTNILASLRQFNSVWLMTEHESKPLVSSEEVAKALSDYVSAGGGLVIAHSGGRYPAAPCDGYWSEVYKTFGLELLHEETVDDTDIRKADEYYDVFYVNEMADHPISSGVSGLWLPFRRVRTWGVTSYRTSPEWTSIVTTTEKGKSCPKDVITNLLKKKAVGSYKHGPVPIVSARSYGKGRIVFMAIHKDCCGWMYGIDRWPNIIERSNWGGRTSDAVRLLENACAWSARPSLSIPGFCNPYVPVEPNRPAYYRQVDFGQRWNEKMSWKPLVPEIPEKDAVGVIGVHSAYSDGESSVAEYVAEAKKLGLDFVVFTDPLARIDADRLEKLRKDCQAASGETFYACPGVEYVDVIGFEWIVFCDKVSFPDETFACCGRRYLTFNGKKMLQRKHYGHENMFRGAVLNLKRCHENGADLGHMSWFNEVVPVAYDVDKVLYDNTPEFLELPRNLHKAVTISYTRVRRASDLRRAMRISTTHAKSLAAFRKLVRRGGAGAWWEACAANVWAHCGEGPSISSYDMRVVPGTDVVRLSFSASSPNGISEVRLEDADTRTLVRFDGKGEKTMFRSFALTWDRQSYPQLVVIDRRGSRAFSTARWMWYYHAGLHRCDDNFNMLSCNPKTVYYTNWDDGLFPLAKFLPEVDKHWHASEAFFWKSYEKAVSREATASVDGWKSPIPIKGSAYPSDAYGMYPSSKTRFPLVQPNVVAIIEQTQGDYVVGPTLTELNASFLEGTIQTRIGDNRYWKRHHRVYQFTDRYDAWWMAVWKQNAPDFRGGYAITEGEIEFTEDLELSGPVRLCEITAANPNGDVKVYANSADSFGPGSWCAVVSDPERWFSFVGLRGGDVSQRADISVDGTKKIASLYVGKAGSYHKGDRLRYRFAIGSFLDDPEDGAYLGRFAGMLDGSMLKRQVKRGRERAVDGLLELMAENHAAVVDLGPQQFLQRYPIRVKGLVDNGTAYFTDGNRVWKPMGFHRGLAYAEVPLEKAGTWWFGNLYVADDSNLRMTFIPAMTGHPKSELQVFNPTDGAINTMIHGTRSGENLKVSVPAGEFLSIDVADESRWRW